MFRTPPGACGTRRASIRWRRPSHNLLSSPCPRSPSAGNTCPAGRQRDPGKTSPCRARANDSSMAGRDRPRSATRNRRAQARRAYSPVPPARHRAAPYARVAGPPLSSACPTASLRSLFSPATHGNGGHHNGRVPPCRRSAWRSAAWRHLGTQRKSPPPWRSAAWRHPVPASSGERSSRAVGGRCRRARPGPRPGKGFRQRRPQAAIRHREADPVRARLAARPRPDRTVACGDNVMPPPVPEARQTCRTRPSRHSWPNRRVRPRS